MATRRKPLPSKAPRRKGKAKRRTVRATRRAPPAQTVLAPVPEGETAQEAIVHIAEDAVLILRRELAWKAEMALLQPGRVSMSDCIALLRLTADLGEAAGKGTDGGAQADYSRLSPEELAQYAALSLKVAYS